MENFSIKIKSGLKDAPVITISNSGIAEFGLETIGQHIIPVALDCIYGEHEGYTLISENDYMPLALNEINIEMLDTSAVEAEMGITTNVKFTYNNIVMSNSYTQEYSEVDLLHIRAWFTSVFETACENVFWFMKDILSNMNILDYEYMQENTLPEGLKILSIDFILDCKELEENAGGN